MSSNALIGNWKLVSWQVVVNGEPTDLFGSRPNGYLILHARVGRWRSPPQRVEPPVKTRWSASSARTIGKQIY